MQQRPPLFLAGPSAVGKSSVALALAERVRGEIISVDSMQVYLGMDIGTAKPTLAERARVPHHLIDVVDLSETFSAAQFVHLAQVSLKSIEERERIPIFCGGTGLYFAAFLNGLGTAPAPDPELRAILDQMALPELLAELKQRDPVAHAAIDRQNRRRIVRALEVIRLSGRPFSEQRSAWRRPSDATREHAEWPLFFGLERSQDELHARIDDRVNRMFAQGLVEETKSLLDRGLAENQTACQALGYRQVVACLRGKESLEATVELIKLRTRQFVKRQMTWFRHQAPIEWIPLGQEDLPETIAARLEGMYMARSGH